MRSQPWFPRAILADQVLHRDQRLDTAQSARNLELAHRLTIAALGSRIAIKIAAIHHAALIKIVDLVKIVGLTLLAATRVEGLTKTHQKIPTSMRQSMTITQATPETIEIFTERG